jgi:hypothetical protein
MRGLWVVIGVFVSAFAATGASATLQSASGDSCTASGNGTAYTLHITVAPGTEQFGFAFGVAGATVTKVVIPGENGNFSTRNLAPNTSGAWVSDTPLTGAPVVSLTTSSRATGSLTVVPFGASQSAYFSSVRCVATGNAPASTGAFAVDPHITYHGTARAWLMVVTIPEGGTVSAAELEATTGTGSAKPVTAKSLIQVRRVVSNTGGKVTLTLRATPIGQIGLKANGMIRLKLHVTFDSTTGKVGSELLALTLRK